MRIVRLRIVSFRGRILFSWRRLLLIALALLRRSLRRGVAIRFRLSGGVLTSDLVGQVLRAFGDVFLVAGQLTGIASALRVGSDVLLVADEAVRVLEQFLQSGDLAVESIAFVFALEEFEQIGQVGEQILLPPQRVAVQDVSRFGRSQGLGDSLDLGLYASRRAFAACAEQQIGPFRIVAARVLGHFEQFFLESLVVAEESLLQDVKLQFVRRL